MLQLVDISYQIEGKPLLQNINWTINPRKRVALIGPNGAGKTTLLRIISETIPPQDGEITKPKSYQIGYLPQEEISFGRGSVLEETLLANKTLQELEAETEFIRAQLENSQLSSAEQKELIEKLGHLEERFRVMDGYTYEAQAKKILMGLGFKEEEFYHPIGTKSGGWRMRIYLARLLLQNPDLLLLDEPTNHLDIESLEWLESYLLDFGGSMIIVSHDRFFIDRLAEEISEIENRTLIHYPGKYAFFEQQKILRNEQILQRVEELRQEKERLTQFINRFRYKASKAPQVQDRIKKLAKLEEIELPKAVREIQFKIVCPQKSYKDVCFFDKVGFRYTDDWVFEDINLNLYRGEKAALVGANGEGKTTITRLLSEELVPQKGALTLGERVSIGYYAQHQIDALNHQLTVFDEVSSVAAEMYRTQIRDILGMFKFSADDINKKISVLSGGEKARVSLAKILLSPVNFLLMDEPTNHLDLDSKKALEKALKEYDGTLLLISHDRYFLDKLVSIVFELKEGKLRRFEGNYSDYLRKKTETIEPEPGGDIGDNKGIKKEKNQKRIEAEARQNISQQRKILSDKIRQIEEEMEKLEQEKKSIEQQMSDPEFYKDQEKSSVTGKRYQDLQSRIPRLLHEWEIKQAELENLLAGLNQL